MQDYTVTWGLSYEVHCDRRTLFELASILEEVTVHFSVYCGEQQVTQQDVETRGFTFWKEPEAARPYTIKYSMSMGHWITMCPPDMESLQAQVRILDRMKVRFVVYNPENRQIIPISTDLDAWALVEGP